MKSLLSDFERLAKKQKTARSSQIAQIDKILSEIERARDEVQRLGTVCDMEEDGESSQNSTEGMQDEERFEQTQKILSSLKTSISPMIADVMGGEGKDAQGGFNKFGKLIDKVMPADLSRAVKPIDMNPALMNEVIVGHLLRTGRIQVAKALGEQAGVHLFEDHIDPFVKLQQVVDALKQRDLGPARAWSQKHETQLGDIGSDLGFKLVQMEFVQLIQAGNVLGAVDLAKARFDKHMPQKLSEIQKLMGCLAFVGRIERSPYSAFFDAGEWTVLAESFARDACSIMGFPRELPLAVCVESGIKALPSLLKFANVMQGKIGDWGTKNALPVEIDLGPDRRYHSVFVCPVSREQASVDNPPMLMQCGHVLCECSLKKLSRGAARFKCPYCPVEVSVQGSTRLYL